MKTIIAALLFMAPGVTSANNILIGDVWIEVPNPPGFTPLTPQMTTLYDFHKHFVAPTVDEFIAFIPESKVPAAMKGESPYPMRRFTVQTAKDLVIVSVSNADFLKFKTIAKSQNDALMDKIESELPGLFGKISSGISDHYGVDLALSVSKIVPLPVHHETDRTLAFSTFIKLNTNDASGNPASYVRVFTLTYVHVKGKILFLYSYAEEAGLQWSREISNEWANAVVAANTPNIQSSVKKSLPSAVTGIDWGKVGTKAISGAFIGLIIGLIAWARKRNKEN